MAFFFFQPVLSDIEVESYLISWNLEHVTRVWEGQGVGKLGLKGSQLIVDSNANQVLSHVLSLFLEMGLRSFCDST